MQLQLPDLFRPEKSESSENNVDALEAVLRATNSLFPGEVKVELSVDPEYPERPSIVFRVANSERLSTVNRRGYPPVANENGHQHAQRAFLDSGEPNAVELGDLLVQLHERRKQADYKLEDERFESLRFVEEAVVRLDRALRALQRCCDEPARTNIRTGIADYRMKINALH
jgi:hypothetical protein